MSREEIRLPSRQDSYVEFNKNQWGMGYSRAPGGVANFRVIDSDLENWVLFFLCDDHPKSIPYPLYDDDDMDTGNDVEDSDDMMEGEMPRKGMNIDVLLLGSSPDILSDKAIKKQINASILKMTGEKLNPKDVVMIDHTDCTYNQDLV